MKTPVTLFALGAVTLLAPPNPAMAQPSLGLQLNAGVATLTITGVVGTVYAIQSANDLSPTNSWAEQTLLQVQSASNFWTDPSAPTTSQRFYRAVSVPAPANTNLVFIQPGAFVMGSPTNEALRGADEAQHLVTISRGFYIGQYLVTQGDCLAMVGSNPSYFNTNNGYGLELSRPVEEVNWNDASNYCALLTQQDQAAGRIPVGWAYRLPTESEWEYACRAGTTTAFYLGSGLHSGQANFVGLDEYDAGLGSIYNPSGIFLGTTTLVGSYAANAWGLYDMIGNVWEWCQDWYGPYPAGSVTDPRGAASGSYRVIRGGSWLHYGQYCRSAQRNSSAPTLANSFTGFRVVLAPGQ